MSTVDGVGGAAVVVVHIGIDKGACPGGVGWHGGVCVDVIVAVVAVLLNGVVGVRIHRCVLILVPKTRGITREMGGTWDLSCCTMYTTAIAIVAIRT